MTQDRTSVSRRRVLKSTGAATAGLALAGRGAAEEGHGTSNCPGYYSNAEKGGGHHGGSQDQLQQQLCPNHPDATTGPGHTSSHSNGGSSACPASHGLDPETCTAGEWPDCTDWPEPTKEIIRESRDSLTTNFDDVGTLLAKGFIPYFDVVLPGVNGGVSHWLNPEFIDDGTVDADPAKPESVIMDNQYWRPLGPMYIATKHGDRVWADEDEEIQAVRQLWGYENECGTCIPWHSHSGMPGRFAWWYYRQVHEGDYASGETEDLTLPCYTPPMMHAWIYPTPHGPHSATSGAPPRRHRPSEPGIPGYPTPAVPGQDQLSYEALPDAVAEAAMPKRLERELRIIAGLPDETLRTATIADLEGIMTTRLDPVGDSLDGLGAVGPVTDGLGDIAGL